MSKSDWKELPDWKQAEEYAFTQNATPEVWAWEVLRRNSDYRTDWQNRNALMAMKHYHPPLAAGESEKQWLARVVLESDTEPTTMREDLHRANKWGLEELYDPQQPFSSPMRFIKPWGDFPRFIFLPDDFYSLVEDDETEERLIEHVADTYAVIGFHLARPLGDQIEAAEKMLQSWKAQLKKADKIKPSGHANKHDKWLRHLRVLDAVRANPSATYADIALMLGGNKNKYATPEQLSKEGDKFVTAARRMMQGSYLKMLLFKGT